MQISESAAVNATAESARARAQIKPNGRDRTSTFSESTMIKTAPADVWHVLADIGSISDWNPGVKESHVINQSASGVGTQRYCGLGGRNYLHESVVGMEEARSLTMRIDETNLPFKSADIRFTLEPVGAGTWVTVSPEYELKYGVFGRLLDRVMIRTKYRRGMAALLRGLKDQVENAQKPQPISGVDR